MKLSDLVIANTSKVSDYKVRKDELRKSDEQKKIDSTFAQTIRNVEQTVRYLCEVKKQSDFDEGQEISIQIHNMLEICKNILEHAQVGTSDIGKIDSANKKINKELTEKWKAYYSKKTSSIKEILSIAKNLSIEKAPDLIKDISNVEQWGESVQDIVRMVDAINKSNELIEQFELNDTIVSFLKKMMLHLATLEDLTEDVTEWIEKENIKKRIKLSF